MGPYVSRQAWAWTERSAKWGSADKTGTDSLEGVVVEGGWMPVGLERKQTGKNVNDRDGE